MRLVRLTLVRDPRLFRPAISGDRVPPEPFAERGDVPTSTASRRERLSALFHPALRQRRERQAQKQCDLAHSVEIIRKDGLERIFIGSSQAGGRMI